MITSIKRVLESAAQLNNLSKEDFQLLKEHKNILESWSDDIIKTFYDTIYSYELTASIPVEGERPKLEKTLTEWYKEIINGELSTDFWKKQWYVGLVHVYRKVDNMYMIFMMSRLQQEFIKKAFENFEKDLAVKLITSFLKITNTILALIVEGYESMYMKCITSMTGINEDILNRMVSIESKKMFTNYKAES